MSFFTELIIMAIGTLIILSGSLLHSFIESNKRVARLFTPSLYCLQTKSGLRSILIRTILIKNAPKAFFMLFLLYLLTYFEILFQNHIHLLKLI